MLQSLSTPLSFNYTNAVACVLPGMQKPFLALALASA